MAKVKAKTLSTLTKGNILKKVDSFRKTLGDLRVTQVSGRGSGKLGEIRVVRKNIARALTIANLKKRTALKAAFAGKKVRPVDLRYKKTRAQRRALTKSEATIKTVRQQKRAALFPLKKITIKA